MHTHLEQSKTIGGFISLKEQKKHLTTQIDYVASIMANIPNYMYIKEATNKTYLACTSLIVKIFGHHSTSEIIDKSNREIIDYFSHKSILPLIELIEEHEDLVIKNNTEYTCIHSEPFINVNGHISLLKMSFIPILDKEKKVTAVQFYAIDISNNINSEELYKLYNLMYPSEKMMIYMFLEHIGFSKYLDKNQCLTKREVDILLMFSNGKTAKEIARAVLISPRTVEKHLDNIKEKVNVKNRLQLMSLMI